MVNTQIEKANEELRLGKGRKIKKKGRHIRRGKM
jgi:hypothetical protein